MASVSLRSTAHLKMYQPADRRADCDHENTTISSLSPVRIKVNFHSQNIYHYSCWSQEGGPIRDVIEIPGRHVMESFIFDPYAIMSQDFIAGVLSRLDVDEQYHDRIGPRVITYARRAAELAISINRNAMPIRVDVTIVRKTVMEESTMERWMLRQAQEFGYRRVPTSKAAITGLGKTTVEVGGNDCTICLEEIAEGSEVARLPCAHVFHGKCIAAWLERSHYCPLCRFEMPTD